MSEEYEKQKRKQVTFRRVVVDYSIGLMITAMGVFFLLRDKFNLQFNERFPPNDIDKIFGVICLLYGGWRIYRGYKKNYFK
jgi:hypothetical protein